MTVVGIVALWVAVQIPFLQTAYRVDETNIVRIAERIAEDPADPYGFHINWGGIDEDAFHILANPPGVPYWLALWGGMLGWTEAVLHAAMLPFGIIALIAFAALAREFDLDASTAVLLMIASPAFFLGAQVVMPDVAMFAAFVTALAAALRYRRTAEWWLVPLGFVAGALAPILKYNGALVGPLLALVWLYGRGRRTGLLVIMAGPAAGLAGWSWWSLMQYGRVHVLTITEFESGGVTNILTALLGFFGLGVVPLVIAGMRAPKPMSDAALHVITAATGLMMATGAKFLLGAGPIASVAYGLSAAIGFRFAVVCGVLALGWFRERDLRDALLLSWVALVVWFQFGLLFASVRYLLPILPAVVLLVMRHRLVNLERARARAGLAVCLTLALAIAIGDAKTANLYRRFVSEVAIPEAAKGDGRFFFDGHWGFQYYMEAAGGRILNYFLQPRWRAGDVLVIARVPFPSYKHPTPSRSIDFETVEFAWSPGWPVRTIDCSAWANFYGPGVMQCRNLALPFGFSTKAADEFVIYRARTRAREPEPAP
jgi:hypothetical protein